MGKIKTFTIDSGDSKTELCVFGDKTDKSPFNVWLHYHKHPYTPIYSLLLGPYRNKKIDFCEIGIAGGDSVKMWNEYFHKETRILAMDSSEGFLKMLDERRLQNVFTMHIDVSDSAYMDSQLAKLDINFDIVVDDSDHNMESQKKILKSFLPFLNPGGMLIIEDIDRANSAEKYMEYFGEEILNQFESVYYINAEHINKFSGDYNNDALLVFIKL
jgi:ubiquinone/menaquinone biosynthesis C-methylase UbiE